MVLFGNRFNSGRGLIGAGGGKQPFGRRRRRTAAHRRHDLICGGHRVFIGARFAAIQLADSGRGHRPAAVVALGGRRDRRGICVYFGIFGAENRHRQHNVSVYFGAAGKQYAD